ncbi:CCR4-NOT transcription complex subunit 4 [Cucumispora dikerogammari]|nr:CCR4-NOT transcription complex subunit 4 [Cucumispora dikerogammari]
MTQKLQKNPQTNSSEIPISELRIIQKNLLFVSNLPITFLNQIELINSQSYFGQFGPIKKTVTIIIRDILNTYITYVNSKDCEKAIYHTDESLVLHDSVIYKIRATYGTTKYCTFFLKNLKCQNIECMYLHKMGEYYDVLCRDVLLYYNENQPNTLNNNKRNSVFHTFHGINKNLLFLGNTPIINDSDNSDNNDNSDNSDNSDKMAVFVVEKKFLIPELLEIEMDLNGRNGFNFCPKRS